MNVSDWESSAVAMRRYRALFCANAASNLRGDWYPSAAGPCRPLNHSDSRRSPDDQDDVGVLVGAYPILLRPMQA